MNSYAQHLPEMRCQGIDQPRVIRQLLCCCAMLCFLSLTGCTTLLSPITGIPAHRVPMQFLSEPRANQIPIDLARLRQDPPKEYLLGPKDILGVYIEGILGKAEEAPPVHFPQDSSKPPALGFPIPIREDDTVALPLIEPIKLSGLTLTQAQNLIKDSYINSNLLPADRARIIVTLIRPRTYQVIVIREDVGGGAAGANFVGNVNNFVRGSLQTGTGQVVNLAAYENDVMHALAATGGLPGLDAKNEVKILRGKHSDATRRDEYIKTQMENRSRDACMCPPPFLDDPSIIHIPLRLPPGEIPNVTEKDIILQDGDIVHIESRDVEVFYTGGLLGGREIPLPRDYDLDILGAIALSGGAIAQNVGGGVGVAGLGGAAPSNAIVLRPLACGGQITIEVDLNKAAKDPASRILIAPGDTIILRYKPIEELTNFGIASFFIYGIQELIRR